MKFSLHSYRWDNDLFHDQRRSINKLCTFNRFVKRHLLGGAVIGPFGRILCVLFFKFPSGPITVASVEVSAPRLYLSWNSANHRDQSTGPYASIIQRAHFM